jgi:hypothetical protein
MNSRLVLVLVLLVVGVVEAKKKKNQRKRKAGGGNTVNYTAKGPFFSLPLTVGSQSRV